MIETLIELAEAWTEGFLTEKLLSNGCDAKNERSDGQGGSEYGSSNRPLWMSDDLLD